LSFCFLAVVRVTCRVSENIMCSLETCGLACNFVKEKSHQVEMRYLVKINRY
jgi:hypothetical protein